MKIGLLGPMLLAFISVFALPAGASSGLTCNLINGVTYCSGDCTEICAGACDSPFEGCNETVDYYYFVGKTEFITGCEIGAPMGGLTLECEPGSFNSLDLTVNTVTLTQPAGTAVPTDESGNFIVATTTPPTANPPPKQSGATVQAMVTVNVSGALTAGVYTDLQIALDTGEILADPIVTLQLGTNIFNVSFPPPTDPSALGVHQLIATINANQSLSGSSSNNRKAISVNNMVLCTTENAGRPVYFWSQVDPSWSSQHLDNITSETIGKYGCALTDTAMAFESYGIETTPFGQTMNPGSLNTSMQNWDNTAASLYGSYAFSKTGGILWPGTADVGRFGFSYQCVEAGGLATQCQAQAANAVSFGNKIDHYDSTVENTVDAQLCAGNPVILRLTKPNGKYHFVLAIGATVDKGQKTYQMNNPGDQFGGGEKLLDESGKYPTISGIRYFVPANDPSMFFSYGSANIDYVITDPLGRRSGYDPTTGIAYNQIPGANYSADSISTPDPTDASSTPVEKVFSNIQSTVEGAYTVDIFGLSTGPYDFDVYSFDNNGYFNSRMDYSGQISANQKLSYTYNHTSANLPTPNARLNISEGNYRAIQTPTGSKTDLFLTGQLEPNARAPIILNKDFQLTIGGLGGVTETFAASAFKSKRGRYIYRSKKTSVSKPDFILINKRGHFEIHLHAISLATVPVGDRGLIFLKVDSLFGEAFEKYECERDHDDKDKASRRESEHEKIQHCHLR